MRGNRREARWDFSRSLSFGMLSLVLLVSGATSTTEADTRPIWYRLRPPVIDGTVDSKAPIRLWEVEAAYDSAADCRDDVALKYMGADLLRSREESRRRLWELEQELAYLRQTARTVPGYREVMEQLEKWKASAPEAHQRDPQEWDRYSALREQWPAAAKILSEIGSKEMEMIFIRISFNNAERALSFRCLPSEALPPGMLPLK